MSSSDAARISSSDAAPNKTKKKKKAPAPEQKKAARRGASKDFSNEECCHFLRIALEVRPSGSREWQMVADEHSVHPEYKNYNRDGKSLPRKYQVLSRTKTPTGDPDIPEHVGLSFDVKKAISNRASISKKGMKKLI